MPCNDDFTGALYGVHAGYMYDFGRIVAGAEIDWDATNINVDVPNSADGVDLDSVARAKLRLGYDAGRFLPYVTAGYARAMACPFDVDAPRPRALRGSRRRTGPTAAVRRLVQPPPELPRAAPDGRPR